MASDSVTLVLDGAPTLTDLSVALAGLHELLEGIGQEVATGQPITWLVNALETGSAVGTFLGTGQPATTVQEVSRRYLGVGQALARGDLPSVTASSAIRAGSAKILGVLNGRVPAVRFETADDEVSISEPRQSPTISATRAPSPAAYGAVIGRVQTLSNRGSLRFTLYDQLYDRPVSCYLQEGQQDIMRGVWDRVALVKGWVKRDPATGRPTSVRRVRDVVPREEGRPGDWRLAAGVLANTGNNEPAEVSIRRLRDAR